MRQFTFLSCFNFIESLANVNVHIQTSFKVGESELSFNLGNLPIDLWALKTPSILFQNNLKIQATKVQHEIEDLQRRTENIKMKLTAEMKVGIPNQVKIVSIISSSDVQFGLLFLW